MTAPTAEEMDKRTELTRRNVLKKGVVTVGVLTLGTGAAAGDHRKTGENMLTIGEPMVGDDFVIVGINPEEAFNFPVSCHGSESAIKGYTELNIDYDGNGSTDQLGAVRNSKLKHLDTTGDTLYEFTSKQGCKDAPTPAPIWRASFKLA